MINSDTRIDEALLLRYFEGEVTLSEKDEIEKWIISSEANKKLAKQIYYLSFATKTMDTLKRTDARAALKEVRGRIRRERQLQWGRWAQRAAAILAIPLLLSTLYYNADRQDEMSFIEVRTNPGMITTIVLPDSSRVWLNSESYLKYPVRFAKNERNVILQGEGYFSVRKNVDSRFIVQTPHHTQIQVLGTEFNVEAYEKEDEVNTTLVSGKVQFQYDSERGKKRMDLLPGEKITYNSISGEVFVSRAAVLSDISWKEGKIILYKTPIEKALRMLSKRFNVDFVITDPALKENSFTGTFIHQRLDRILEHFRISSGLRFRYIETTDSTQEKSKIEIY
ncbi:FecR family protein [Phocaeicola vulgatus]|uniref:FecR family protein n=1 Tax=Phocaeicola vulgatus TaxID=821 RepID=UPI001C21869D|nr:FecR domain-containing protein [Phocaeicola vulgatus]MBU8981956.1 FecR domain-containing protein [Phocaeicola vulgatus]MBU9015319.1 FecR domain-containing protein [Phocaeicola vulgatus]MBU9028783.1 FecR domain-containing protein [Phocaeicola vulgatus]MBU9033213.1 FecR domain-containing protein [Phocaeicola vulgatus]MBU9046079.1 FecR domain-containing protein [Phocaeicola vulgatus]